MCIDRTIILPFQLMQSASTVGRRDAFLYIETHSLQILERATLKPASPIRACSTDRKNARIALWIRIRCNSDFLTDERNDNEKKDCNSYSVTRYVFITTITQIFYIVKWTHNDCITSYRILLYSRSTSWIIAHFNDMSTSCGSLRMTLIRRFVRQ